MKNPKKQVLDTFEIDILKAKLFFSKEAVLVYQMGKVGSTTVYSSLKRQLFFTPVFHVHFLSQDELQNQERAYKKVGIMPHKVRHIRQGKLIDYKLNRGELID